MYVAVKGGEAAIASSIDLLGERRRGDPAVDEISTDQIREQMRLAVDRVMTEGSLYDPELAALALKQASGDTLEAVFLLRAHRTTLPRLGYTRPLDTGRMQALRRVSATFKDLPGGQLLGPSYDYTQRLLNFELLGDSAPAVLGASNDAFATAGEEAQASESLSGALGLLAKEGLVEEAPACDEEPGDLTREPLRFPASRALRLQNLARGDEGFVLATAYSTQRGYSHSHPFVGELRMGLVEVQIDPEELGFPISIGEIEVTECQMVNQFSGSKHEPPSFTRGYGLVFGQCERKAMAMALVDRSLRASELGEAVTSPAQMQEFVLSHSDALEASGFVSHLKLPHYVDFQAELELVRRMREAHAQGRAQAPDEPVVKGEPE